MKLIRVQKLKNISKKYRTLVVKDIEHTIKLENTFKFYWTYNKNYKIQKILKYKKRIPKIVEYIKTS